MPSDYKAIRADNERRYGTDIGRIGPMLLADRYDDRTHFIFELLQNAEDALARRDQWQGARAVSFQLTDTQLRFSHFGQPFCEADVRGICGIAESTKALTAIGRFGIGFKSVYAITDRPEVHSGTEAFAVESFVWPVGVQRASRDDDETLFVLPFKSGDSHALDDVSRGLQRLGTTALLFLRQIEEVRWRVKGGPPGTYLRESRHVADGVRRVTVIGQQHDADDVDDEWLVFSQAVAAQDGRHAGYVEIAFSLSNQPPEGEAIQRVERSPLVVFFPTVVETHFGFLLQGPYRTTPSRDNVPRSDPWNQHLVEETGSLLVDALRWLRENELLDAAALRCLPIDPSKFGEASMFAPLFQVTKEALSSERLLPRFGDGHTPADRARLGRTQELRDLFSASQLAALLGEDGELSWLSGDISQDRAPELRRYVMQELSVTEITPETIIPRLDQSFLEAQPDDWILNLYEFLGGQAALRRRLDGLPLIRLVDGSHVPPRVDGQPQAFLPSTITTGFPTVRASVCGTESARELLRSLGLTEPDPVDDVVRNVLPKYRSDKVDIADDAYESDIRRILAAFSTDSKDQREKLLVALRETPFVMAVDTGNARKYVERPASVYLSTERLKELFAGIPDVLRVDDAYSCLRGEEVRELLVACGAVRYLRPVADASLSWEQRQELRERAGHAETSNQNDRITDWSLVGLRHLLSAFPGLSSEEQVAKAWRLWEELANLEERRGKSVFTGEYTWTHYGTYRTIFDAAFIRELNETAWIPDENGDLHRPEFVLFDTLGWKANPFLESKIRFKPPIIEALAKEAGIETGVLDLLKKHGVTSVAELVVRLGLAEDSEAGESDQVSETAKEGVEPADDTLVTTPSAPRTQESKPGGSGDAGGGSGTTTAGTRGSGSGGRRESDGTGERARTEPKDAPGRKERDQTPERTPAMFISYVGAHPDDEEPDPDGLDQQARMALEAKAIEFILSREPEWRRTPTHNPGYDLYVADEGGNATRWCEVKAMTGSLNDHPVGLSRTQFDHAREHGEAYWLYVVEHAGTDAARIVRIQDPAGKARTFTFDRGWINVAEVDGSGE
ncbi:DUF3883 domain-containing protein [Thioalkalivibrio thiocyanodenitrificans]|uniref:DUF3883 domain-containing protein n=1 Tax=Thioalkalivibrio thiocyanodenitrificans TaxID=243063 RepID=UPI00036B0E55|nr:DUF3883 domain-containing protein [Thioalkalivibrio thiocyanodenitrificans]